MLIFLEIACIIAIVFRGVAQVVERYFREVEAASSSLVTPMKNLADTVTGICRVFYMCFGLRHPFPEVFRQAEYSAPVLCLLRCFGRPP